MIGIVVVTHGNLASEIVNAARTIVGEIPAIRAVSIGWADEVGEARAAIEGALAEVGGGPALLLTDMFGGTPSNLAISAMERDNVEVIAGVNLPMLVKLASIRGECRLQEAITQAQEAGRKYISVASQILAAK